MKKLYTLLSLLLFSMVAFSQDPARDLKIENLTACVQFVVVEWVNNNGCKCDYSSGGGASTIIKIEPYGSLGTVFGDDDNNANYVPNDVLITAAKVGGGYYCSESSVVGQPCSNHPSTTQYIQYDENCNLYCKTLAIWYTGDCGNPATLILKEQ